MYAISCMYAMIQVALSCSTCLLCDLDFSELICIHYLSCVFVVLLVSLLIFVVVVKTRRKDNEIEKFFN